MSRVVIAGGGLAGGLAAIALAKRHPELDLLLVEQGEQFGGNHTWSFFDTDVPASSRWVIHDIARHHWPDHEIRFPRRERTIPIGYNSFRAKDLDAAIRRALRPDQYRLGVQIEDVATDGVMLRSGEQLQGSAVIDARGPEPIAGLELGWQKFVGQILRFRGGHGVGRPIIMDATVAQHDGYRFLYFLPLSETDLLIEDTYYSRSPVLDRAVLERRIGEVVAALGKGEPELVEDEEGVLPLVIDGDLQSLWPAAVNVPRLGLRGGFFHPTTSYSLPDAVANAAFVAEQPELTSEALARALRGRAAKLWSERGFFRFLNRLLFRAAEPDQSYRVLEHFYRLPPPVIARFYAAQLTPFDRLRVLTGKPPVPIGRALSVIGKSAA